jgi:hypothetical protein
MVSAFKLARRREIVSRPPEKTLSTATAEAGKDSEGRVNQKEQKTHLGWTRYHMRGDTGWEMKIDDLTTTELGYKSRSPLGGASRTRRVRQLVHEAFEIEQ